MFKFGIQLAYLKRFYQIDSFAFISARYTIKFVEPYETEIHNELWLINFYMTIGITNYNFWSDVQTKMRVLLFFNSIHDYWPPNTRNSLAHNLWSEMERCEKRAFYLLEMRNMHISWNIKIN